MDGLDAIAANGNVSLSNFRLTNLGKATQPTDAARYDQVISLDTTLD
jgi:hypothetical protein